MFNALGLNVSGSTAPQRKKSSSGSSRSHRKAGSTTSGYTHSSSSSRRRTSATSVLRAEDTKRTDKDHRSSSRAADHGPANEEEVRTRSRRTKDEGEHHTEDRDSSPERTKRSSKQTQRGVETSSRIRSDPVTLIPGAYPEKGGHDNNRSGSSYAVGLGYGAAADYYGDQGQSVDYQPGVRVRTPIVMDAEPHLQAASAQPNPPEETGQGHAAEFYSSADFQSNIDAVGSSMQSSGSYSQSPNGPSSRPNKPGKTGIVSSNAGYYAAGAAGIGAAAAMAYHHQHHKQEQSTSQSFTHSQSQPQSQSQSQFRPQPQSQPQAQTHSSSSRPSRPVYAAGPSYDLAEHSRHIHKGPFSRFVDWWQDYEDVEKMEEYTEYLGICKYCFDPNSTSRDAPRQHRPRKRRSMELKNRTKVDKESRYNNDGIKAAASLTGAGLAAYGMSKAGSSSKRKEKDFDDYSIRAGVAMDAQSSSGSERKRKSKRRERSVSHGIIDSASRAEKGSTRRVSFEQQHRNKHDSEHRSTSNALPDVVGFGAGVAGAAASGSVYANTHRREDDWVRSQSIRRKRSSTSINSSVSSSSSSASEQGFLASFFSPSSKKKKKKQQQREKKTVAKGKNTSSFYHTGNQSTDTNLAYGSESLSKKGSKKDARRSHSDAAKAAKALAGLGAAATLLAAAETGRQRRRTTDDTVHKTQLGQVRHKRSSEQSDGEWESASENEHHSDASSGLVFGSDGLGLHASARSSSDSLSSSASSGTDKWGWRWRQKKQDKGSPQRSAVDAARRGPQNASDGAQSLLHRDSTDRRHKPSADAPLKFVEPVPTSDPNAFDAESRSVSRKKRMSGPIVSSPASDLPLKQPKPTSPPKRISYEPPSEPSMTEPSYSRPDLTFAGVVDEIGHRSSSKRDSSKPVDTGSPWRSTPVDVRRQRSPTRKERGVSWSKRESPTDRSTSSTAQRAAVFGGMAAIVAGAVAQEHQKARVTAHDWESDDEARTRSKGKEQENRRQASPEGTRHGPYAPSPHTYTANFNEAAGAPDGYGLSRRRTEPTLGKSVISTNEPNDSPALDGDDISRSRKVVSSPKTSPSDIRHHQGFADVVTEATRPRTKIVDMPSVRQRAESEPIFDVDIFDPDLFKRDLAGSRPTTDAQSTDAVFADLADRYDRQPASMAEVFAPPELRSSPRATDSRVDSVAIEDRNRRNTDQSDQIFALNYDGVPKPVPKLAVIVPTPPVSIAGSTAGSRPSSRNSVRKVSSTTPDTAAFEDSSTSQSAQKTRGVDTVSKVSDDGQSKTTPIHEEAKRETVTEPLVSDSHMILVSDSSTNQADKQTVDGSAAEQSSQKHVPSDASRQTSREVGVGSMPGTFEADREEEYEPLMAKQASSEGNSLSRDTVDGQDEGKPTAVEGNDYSDASNRLSNLTSSTSKWDAEGDTQSEATYVSQAVASEPPVSTEYWQEEQPKRSKKSKRSRKSNTYDFSSLGEEASNATVERKVEDAEPKNEELADTRSEPGYQQTMSKKERKKLAKRRSKGQTADDYFPEGAKDSENDADEMARRSTDYDIGTKTEGQGSKRDSHDERRKEEFLRNMVAGAAPEIIPLPDSRPSSPYEAEDQQVFTPPRESAASPVTARTPSSTAIPLTFRKPFQSPGLARDAPASSPSTPEASARWSTPRAKHSRTGSSGMKEFRPLYIVERNSAPPAQAEEFLPELPSSRTASETSSVRDGSDGFEDAVESLTEDLAQQNDIKSHFDRPRQRDIEPYLDSQHTTPRAYTFPAGIVDEPDIDQDGSTHDETHDAGKHTSGRNILNDDASAHVAAASVAGSVLAAAAAVAIGTRKVSETWSEDTEPETSQTRDDAGSKDNTHRQPGAPSQPTKQAATIEHQGCSNEQSPPSPPSPHVQPDPILSDLSIRSTEAKLEDKSGWAIPVKVSKQRKGKKSKLKGSKAVPIVANPSSTHTETPSIVNADSRSLLSSEYPADQETSDSHRFTQDDAADAQQVADPPAREEAQVKETPRAPEDSKHIDHTTSGTKDKSQTPPSQDRSDATVVGHIKPEDPSDSNIAHLRNDPEEFRADTVPLMQDSCAAITDTPISTKSPDRDIGPAVALGADNVGQKFPETVEKTISPGIEILRQRHSASVREEDVNPMPSTSAEPSDKLIDDQKSKPNVFDFLVDDSAPVERSGTLNDDIPVHLPRKVNVDADRQTDLSTKDMQSNAAEESLSVFDFLDAEPGNREALLSSVSESAIRDNFKDKVSERYPPQALETAGSDLDSTKQILAFPRHMPDFHNDAWQSVVRQPAPVTAESINDERHPSRANLNDFRMDDTHNTAPAEPIPFTAKPQAGHSRDGDSEVLPVMPAAAVSEVGSSSSSKALTKKEKRKSAQKSGFFNALSVGASAWMIGGPAAKKGKKDKKGSEKVKPSSVANAEQERPLSENTEVGFEASVEQHSEIDHKIDLSSEHGSRNITLDQEIQDPKENSTFNNPSKSTHDPTQSESGPSSSADKQNDADSNNRAARDVGDSEISGLGRGDSTLIRNRESAEQPTPIDPPVDDEWTQLSSKKKRMKAKAAPKNVKSRRARDDFQIEALADDADLDLTPVQTSILTDPPVLEQEEGVQRPDQVAVFDASANDKEPATPVERDHQVGDSHAEQQSLPDLAKTQSLETVQFSEPHGAEKLEDTNDSHTTDFPADQAQYTLATETPKKDKPEQKKVKRPDLVTDTERGAQGATDPPAFKKSPYQPQPDSLEEEQATDVGGHSQGITADDAPVYDDWTTSSRKTKKSKADKKKAKKSKNFNSGGTDVQAIDATLVPNPSSDAAEKVIEGDEDPVNDLPVDPSYDAEEHNGMHAHLEGEVQTQKAIDADEARPYDPPSADLHTAVEIHSGMQDGAQVSELFKEDEATQDWALTGSKNKKSNKKKGKRHSWADLERSSTETSSAPRSHLPELDEVVPPGDGPSASTPRQSPLLGDTEIPEQISYDLEERAENGGTKYGSISQTYANDHTWDEPKRSKKKTKKKSQSQANIPAQDESQSMPVSEQLEPSNVTANPPLSQPLASEKSSMMTESAGKKLSQSTTAHGAAEFTAAIAAVAAVAAVRAGDSASSTVDAKDSSIIGSQHDVSSRISDKHTDKEGAISTDAYMSTSNFDHKSRQIHEEPEASLRSHMGNTIPTDQFAAESVEISPEADVEEDKLQKSSNDADVELADSQATTADKLTKAQAEVLVEPVTEEQATLDDVEAARANIPANQDVETSMEGLASEEPWEFTPTKKQKKKDRKKAKIADASDSANDQGIPTGQSQLATAPAAGPALLSDLRTSSLPAEEGALHIIDTGNSKVKKDKKDKKGKKGKKGKQAQDKQADTTFTSDVQFVDPFADGIEDATNPLEPVHYETADEQSKPPADDDVGQEEVSLPAHTSAADVQPADPSPKYHNVQSPHSTKEEGPLAEAAPKTSTDQKEEYKEGDEGDTSEAPRAETPTHLPVEVSLAKDDEEAETTAAALVPMFQDRNTDSVVTKSTKVDPQEQGLNAVPELQVLSIPSLESVHPHMSTTSNNIVTPSQIYVEGKDSSEDFELYYPEQKSHVSGLADQISTDLNAAGTRSLYDTEDRAQVVDSTQDINLKTSAVERSETQVHDTRSNDPSSCPNHDPDQSLNDEPVDTAGFSIVDRPKAHAAMMPTSDAYPAHEKDHHDVAWFSVVDEVQAERVQLAPDASAVDELEAGPNEALSQRVPLNKGDEATFDNVTQELTDVPPAPIAGPDENPKNVEEPTMLIDSSNAGATPSTAVIADRSEESEYKPVKKSKSKNRKEKQTKKSLSATAISSHGPDSTDQVLIDTRGDPHSMDLSKSTETATVAPSSKSAMDEQLYPKQHDDFHDDAWRSLFSQSRLLDPSKQSEDSALSPNSEIGQRTDTGFSDSPSVGHQSTQEDQEGGIEDTNMKLFDENSQESQGAQTKESVDSGIPPIADTKERGPSLQRRVAKKGPSFEDIVNATLGSTGFGSKPLDPANKAEQGMADDIMDFGPSTARSRSPGSGSPTKPSESWASYSPTRSVEDFNPGRHSSPGMGIGKDLSQNDKEPSTAEILSPEVMVGAAGVAFAKAAFASDSPKSRRKKAQKKRNAHFQAWDEEEAVKSVQEHHHAQPRDSADEVIDYSSQATQDSKREQPTTPQVHSRRPVLVTATTQSLLDAEAGLSSDTAARAMEEPTQVDAESAERDSHLFRTPPSDRKRTTPKSARSEDIHDIPEEVAVDSPLAVSSQLHDAAFNAKTSDLSLEKEIVRPQTDDGTASADPIRYRSNDDGFESRFRWPGLEEQSYLGKDETLAQSEDSLERPKANSASQISAEVQASNASPVAAPLKDNVRPSSALSARSAASSHSFRRDDQSRRSDARAVSKPAKEDAKDAKHEDQQPVGTPAASEVASEKSTRRVPSYDPLRGSGRDRKSDIMAQENPSFEGWGDAPGSPLSPSRPASIRKRQSLQIIELENRLAQAMDDNKALRRGSRGFDAPPRDLSSGSYSPSRDSLLREREGEIKSLKASLQLLRDEVTRLGDQNTELMTINKSITKDAEARLAQLEQEHAHASEQWQQSSHELANMKSQQSELSRGMEDAVRGEVSTALSAKDAEIQSLREELADATDQVRDLHRQLVASKGDDSFLVSRDMVYFTTHCTKLCQHVQQWVIRFSKYSDGKIARVSTQLKNDDMETRLDNCILDGSDVDAQLKDRVRRRDVFMSVVMNMIWEFIFTRYLFGMDREQRQKLKSLEKTLTEVGPARAVAQWRVITLSLLSRREAFHDQRSEDTEAVVQEIYGFLAKILPPPRENAESLQDSLRNVLRIAVDLSIEMRTQRPEFIMLPPLKPEYDTNGDLTRKFFFNAALMDERSGEGETGEELQANQSVVRMVLFPLVVKKGDDHGVSDEEKVVYKAQVLVARASRDKRASRARSTATLHQAGKSVQSLIPESIMDTEQHRGSSRGGDIANVV